LAKLSAAEQEILYGTSRGLYEVGDYAEAAQFFTQLVLEEPFQELYWRGLASAHQMEEKYQEALHAWGLVALLVDPDPLPHFHAAECLLSLDDRPQALKALQCAEERLTEEQAELREKINILKRIYVHTTC
jgi:type III secretion system low calcium response chaperone LcrH/SycD